MNKLFIFLTLLSVWFLFPPFINAQSNKTIEAKVVEILEEKLMVPEGGVDSQIYQKLKLKINKGGAVGKEIVLENGNIQSSSIQKYKVGDNIVIESFEESGNVNYFILDYVRRDSLVLLFIIFVIITIITGKWFGLTSLVGMGLSFGVIFSFILPRILAGDNPVLVAILGSLLIVPLTFYLSHGFNRKTSIAIIGTVIALIITGIISIIFIEITKLTGYSSEEANFVQSLYMGRINIKGLLLAGIIISGIGVFDDVTVSQSSIVSELKESSPNLKSVNLYKKAMNVGRDHIASVVNTLVLVYAGASLPLLILFMSNSVSFSDVINYEIIAEEIVKTLVASIGLILSVPITTLIATYSLNISPVKSK